MLELIDNDINSVLVKNPISTFFARYKSEDDDVKRFNNGDLFVIDKSLDPSHGVLVVCVIDGKFNIRTTEFKDDGIYFTSLKNNNSIKYDPTIFENYLLWGVIIYIIKKV
jgi:DNA polymerase V